MVSSKAYPGLERKPGGPDNWVEAAGGLPKYIERIAKHLHYEQGMSISHAIASAVNTVKRWARMGKVAKYGDPNNKHVTPATVAKAQAAVAAWEAKRAKGKLNLSDVGFFIIDLTEVGDEFDYLASMDWSEDVDYTGAGAEANIRAILSSMDIQPLADRANAIEDPEARAEARARVLELAFGRDFDPTKVIDLASTIPPRNARGRASDGRKSFKGQGKWKHGHIPLNRAAKEAKAKGSPIAMKRMNRLFGGEKAADDAPTQTKGPKTAAPKTSKPAPKQPVKAATGRVGNRHDPSGKKVNRHNVVVDEKSQPGSEKANSLAAIRNTSFNTRDQNTKASLPESQKEANKSTRVPKRAKQNWDEIPDNLKTVRNGERYVLAEYGGKGFITKWVGGVQTGETTNTSKQVSITSADAGKLSQARIRALLADKSTPTATRRILRRALAAKGGS